MTDKLKLMRVFFDEKKYSFLNSKWRNGETLKVKRNEEFIKQLI